MTTIGAENRCRSLQRERVASKSVFEPNSGINGFGLLARLRGHRRVPLPPHKTTGTIVGTRIASPRLEAIDVADPRFSEKGEPGLYAKEILLIRLVRNFQFRNEARLPIGQARWVGLCSLGDFRQFGFDEFDAFVPAVMRTLAEDPAAMLRAPGPHETDRGCGIVAGILQEPRHQPVGIALGEPDEFPFPADFGESLRMAQDVMRHFMRYRGSE